jgi:hypothetical protein
MTGHVALTNNTRSRAARSSGLQNTGRPIQRNIRPIMLVQICRELKYGDDIVDDHMYNYKDGANGSFK